MEKQNLKILQERVALTRDEQAYKQLFLHFYKLLTPFANTIIKSHEVSEEVVSTVLLNIWQLEEKLMEVADLNVYLFRSTKNRSLNSVTRNQRIVPLQTTKYKESLYDEAPDPYELLQRTEIKRHLEKAVAALPPRCGMVYHLVKEKELTYREVAGIMTISENTVDRQLNNALHKLMAAMRAYLNEKPRQKKWKLRMGRSSNAGVLIK